MQHLPETNRGNSSCRLCEESGIVFSDEKDEADFREKQIFIQIRPGHTYFRPFSIYLIRLDVNGDATADKATSLLSLS